MGPFFSIFLFRDLFGFPFRAESARSLFSDRPSGSQDREDKKDWVPHREKNIKIESNRSRIGEGFWGRGSQKGSEKGGLFSIGFTVKKGSEKGSQKGF